MQKVWNVIQGLLVTGASVSVMGLVANQYVGQKSVVGVNLPPQKSGLPKLANPITEPSNATTIDIPLPPGRISGITQTVVISGGRITSASVTVEE
jgi:hypothetical protein